MNGPLLHAIEIFACDLKSPPEYYEPDISMKLPHSAHMGSVSSLYAQNESHMFAQRSNHTVFWP
jgi:hypothetical protein